MSCLSGVAHPEPPKRRVAMFVSIPIFGYVRRTACRSDVAVPKRAARRSNAPTKPSIKYASVVSAGVAFFGLLSPANATPQRHELSSLTDVSASRPTADDSADLQNPKTEQGPARDLTSHLPWLAPVGHRQPRLVDIPPDKSLTARGRAQQQRLNKQPDQKLIICRC